MPVLVPRLQQRSGFLLPLRFAQVHAGHTQYDAQMPTRRPVRGLYLTVRREWKGVEEGVLEGDPAQRKLRDGLDAKLVRIAQFEPFASFSLLATRRLWWVV